MNLEADDFLELHSIMDVLQSIDIGLVVLDQHYNIHLWNGFMESHSGLAPELVANKCFFEMVDDVPEDWFRRKAEPVFQLKSQAFTIWEQRPYLFRFKNNHPITGRSAFMYQNTCIIPLQSAQADKQFICLIVYDVTDIAIGKKDLIKANNNLAKIGRTDALTQLYNRGHWEDLCIDEFARGQDSETPSSLIMLDIDHFKVVNDTYGHQAGDDVIRQTSGLLRKSIRDSDIAGRYGGEEFTILLPKTCAKNAAIVAEQIRATIEGHTVHTEGHSINFTVSLGVAECQPIFTKHTEWIEAADKALYKCKEGGRNQFHIFEF